MNTWAPKALLGVILRSLKQRFLKSTHTHRHRHRHTHTHCSTLRARPIQGFQRPRWNNKKNQVLCYVLAQEQTWQGLVWGCGLGIKQVKVLVPGYLAFPLEETGVISPKAAVMCLWSRRFLLCNMAWLASRWLLPVCDSFLLTCPLLRPAISI